MFDERRGSSPRFLWLRFVRGDEPLGSSERNGIAVEPPPGYDAGCVAKTPAVPGAVMLPWVRPLAFLLAIGVAQGAEPLPALACPAGGDCFADEVWAKVGVRTCLTCHKPGGDAEDSKFVLADPRRVEGPARDAAMRHNRDAFARMAGLKADGRSRLLLKVVGGLRHGGGDVLPADSPGYRVLAAFRPPRQRRDGPAAGPGRRDRPAVLRRRGDAGRPPAVAPRHAVARRPPCRPPPNSMPSPAAARRRCTRSSTPS